MFPKLMKNSLEKISLIQILGNKSFIDIFVFLKKATTTVSIIFQLVFTSSFELGFLSVFIHCQPIEHSHSSMFRRLSECKCETFFQRPCPCNLDSQTSIPASFQLSLHKKWYAQTNPWICHWSCLENNWFFNETFVLNWKICIGFIFFFFSNSFNIVVFNYSNSNEIVFLCMGVIYYLFSVKVKIYLKKFQQTVAKILS